jgi:hypothetical protein
LLLSVVDSTAKQSIGQLIRISDGISVVRWIPDWSAIIERTYTKGMISLSKNTVAAVHPALLPDGDIIFNTGLSLVRLSPCSSKPIWVLNEEMHHSNDIDSKGDIWTPSVSLEGFGDNSWLNSHVRDDAIAQESFEQAIFFAHTSR